MIVRQIAPHNAFHTNLLCKHPFKIRLAHIFTLTPSYSNWSFIEQSGEVTTPIYSLVSLSSIFFISLAMPGRYISVINSSALMYKYYQAFHLKTIGQQWHFEGLNPSLVTSSTPTQLLTDACNRSTTRSEHSLLLCLASNSSPSSTYNRATRSRRDIQIQFFTFSPCPCELWGFSIMELMPTQTAGPVLLTRKRPCNGSYFFLGPL